MFLQTQNGARKFRTIDDDDQIFEGLILKEGVLRPPHFEIPSQRRLVEAKEFFHRELEKISRNDLLRTIQTLCHSNVLVYAVDTNLEATQIFELHRASEKIEGKYDPPDEDQLLRYHCMAFEPWEDGSGSWVKPNS